ncbi:MAG: alanine racemase [Gemmatimonadota bacterium]
MTRSARTLHDLPTPALLLDAGALERNLARMQQRADALGVRLRPHIKTHKCLEIARRQRELGAHGLTVSTLEEARIFADHGFDDLTWAFPVPLSRVEQAAELAGRVRLGLTVDSEAAIDALERAGRPFTVWLKVDCGYGRAGVDPSSERAVALVRRLHESPRLEPAGLLTHSGHAYAGDSPGRIAEIAEQERRVMVRLAERLRAEGLDPGVLSVGSTPAMARVRRLDGVDEVRPGNYALYDYTQASLGSCAIEECAATVLATVVSARPDRCVIDAGALALSKDVGPDDPPHFGPVCADPARTALDSAGRVVSVSQEHGIVDRPLRVGERVRIVPNHSCLTVACFDAFTVVRGTELLATWKIWRNR